MGQQLGSVTFEASQICFVFFFFLRWGSHAGFGICHVVPAGTWLIGTFHVQLSYVSLKLISQLSS